MAKLTKKLQQIRSTLKSNLESVRAMGGDKTKVDTTEEKNKIAELLAGAQEEIGDLFKHTAPSKTTTQEDAGIELEKRLIEFEIDRMKDALSNSLEPYEKYDSEGVIKRDPNVKHIYKDGSWDRKQKDIENVGYVAELMNPQGFRIGLKLNKNDKQVYARPEFVAKQLGLVKVLGKNYYMSNNDEDESLYTWDTETHSFKLSDIDSDGKPVQRTYINIRYRDNVDRHIDNM
jgi:hypothetical protein